MFEWDVGLVTLTEIDAAGFVGLQVDVPGEKKAGVESGEMGFPYGVFGRPLDPSLDTGGEPIPSQSAACIYSYYGSELHVWPQSDPRMQVNLPRPGKGGTVFYGGPAATPSWLHHKADGSTELIAGISPATVVLDASGATLGAAAGAMPVALATQLVAYLGAVETLLVTMATAIDAKLAATPGVSVGVVNTFISANAATKAAIAATLVKAV